MGFLFRCVFAIVFLTVTMAAQAQTNQAPAAGYAIVTPVSGNQAGLLVVETLSFTSISGTVETEVSPSATVTTLVTPVRLGTVTAGTTAIAIVNQTAAAGNIQLTVTDSLGMAILVQTVSILPRAQFARFLAEIFAGQFDLNSSISGLLTIKSDVPVAVVALNFRDEGFAALPISSLESPFPLTTQNPLATTSVTPTTTITGTVPTFTGAIFPTVTGTIPTLTGTIPTIAGTVPPITTATIPTVVFPTVSVISAFNTTTTAARIAAPITAAQTVPATATIGGTGAFIFPQVANVNGWSTSLRIANTSTATQTIRIDFFDPNGVLVSSQAAVVIPPFGLFTFSQ